MGYVITLVIVILLVTVLFNFTELSTRSKTTIAVILLLSIGVGYLYEQTEGTRREYVMTVALKYRQHKPIQCNGVDVNDSFFSYSEGTHSFIGRSGTPYADQLFSLEQCH